MEKSEFEDFYYPDRSNGVCYTLPCRILEMNEKQRFFSSVFKVNQYFVIYQNDNVVLWFSLCHLYE